jgi:hypothetical protein
MRMTTLKMSATLLTACSFVSGAALLAQQGQTRGTAAPQKGEGAVVGDPAPRPTIKPIPPDQFGDIHAVIKPHLRGESKFLDDVDWIPSLWEARQKAAAEGKPLFIMEMGGPPLGLC